MVWNSEQSPLYRTVESFNNSTCKPDEDPVARQCGEPKCGAAPEVGKCRSEQPRKCSPPPGNIGGILQKLTGDRDSLLIIALIILLWREKADMKLIAALAEKILSMPLAKLPGIVQTAAGSITTDMSVTDLYSLATQFQDGGELTMASCMVPSITGMYKSASYVFCDDNALASMMRTIEAGGDASEITGSTSKLAQQLGVK